MNFLNWSAFIMYQTLENVFSLYILMDDIERRKASRKVTGQKILKTKLEAELEACGRRKWNLRFTYGQDGAVKI